MFAMATVAAAVMALAQSARGVPIGTAAGFGEESCVAFPTERLSPRSVVTLVEFGWEGTTTHRTVIGERMSSCRALAKHMVPGPYYRLVLPSREEPYGLMIAFAGDVQSVEDPSGAKTFHLGATYPRVQVRECSSREGVHLTVWERTPLKSARIWHQYVYLGYDVEPDCQEADARDER